MFFGTGLTLKITKTRYHICVDYFCDVLITQTLAAIFLKLNSIVELKNDSCCECVPGVVKPYWPIKEDVKVFNKALRMYFKHDYKTLMSGQPIPHLYLSQKLKLSELTEPENLLEMLVYNGYLSAMPSRTQVLPVKKRTLGANKNETVLSTITFHNVSIPNKEILTAFHKIIRSEAKLKMMQAARENVKFE